MTKLFETSKAEATTSVERAYLAGFIDGEGTVTANFRMTAGSRKEAVHYRLMIPNTNVEVLRWIQSVFGGKFMQCGKPKSPKHKQVYYVYWGGPDCIPVLRSVMPYLHIKRQQAELVFALHELRLPRGRSRRRGVTPEVHESRKNLVGTLKGLNHRGVEQESETVQ